MGQKYQNLRQKCQNLRQLQSLITWVFWKLKDIQRLDKVILLIRFIDKKCSANENDEIRITTTNLVGAH